MFGPLTGPTAVGSLPLLGATAIYRQVNEAGGINGRTLQVLVEDDACDPNKTIAATKKQMSQDTVFMNHSGWFSGTVMATTTELARKPNFPYHVLSAPHPEIRATVKATISDRVHPPD